MDREQLLHEIMKTDFALTDLRLFLDTHPCEKEAIKHFNHFSTELRKLKKEFESKFGPLNALSESYENRFNWIDDPWPWQNKGGER